ncbi:MAG: hypothetical protein KDA42_16590 [Planctomycetales bacterium]|nr:hypothetical protein [Planctomycetales bacterium]
MNRAAVTRCWLCSGNLEASSARSEEVILAEIVPEQIRRSAASFALSTLLLLVTILCVAFGLADFAPGLSGLLLLIVLPAFLITVIRTRRHEARGEQVSTGRKVESFVISAALIVATFFGLAALAFLAFFVYCLVALSRGGF